MTSKIRSLGALFILAFGLNFVGCASTPKATGPIRPWQKAALRGSTQRTVDAFGITFVIRVWPSNKPTVPVATALDLAVAEINRISKMADGAIPGGEVNMINTKAFQEAVPISPELAQILIDCNRMYQLSDLRFDVTYTPYKTKAEFTDSDFNRITDWDTKEPLGPKSYRMFGDKNLILDTAPINRVRMYNQRIRLNLKGMIRGYAAERAVKILMRQGLGGIAVIADGFFAAIGTPFKDPNLMCIEDPKNIGGCAYKITASDPRKVLYIGTSASQERAGKMFDPKEVWTLRSGGVVVAGETGGWVQFATTITAVMDDLTLNALFNKLKSPKVSGTYFIKDPSGVGSTGMLDGSLSPFASTTKVGK
jgi:thiamine biosynthesis lipoprotein ApbE